MKIKDLPKISKEIYYGISKEMDIKITELLHLFGIHGLEDALNESLKENQIKKIKLKEE